MYSYLQQQLFIPWLLVSIWLNNFLSADPQQQPPPTMIIHHPLEDFNKHLMLLSALHHMHSLALPHHPLLGSAGTQPLIPQHPGLPHLPSPFQIPLQSAMLDAHVTPTSQTNIPINAQTQMINPNQTMVSTTSQELVTTTTLPTSLPSHPHPQAIPPSLPSPAEEQVSMNNSMEASTRRKSQVKVVQDSMLQNLEVTIEAKSNGPTLAPSTITTSTTPQPASTTIVKKSSSYESLMVDSTPKTTLKGKVVKTAASIETMPMKQPTSVFIKEEQANLIRQHLDNTDLENFLHSANLSAHDAQIFLKLVEKVLEEEVSKRLQKHSTSSSPHTSATQTTSSISSSTTSKGLPPQPGITPTTTLPTEINQPARQLDNEEIEDKILTHELKTVNTRLSYASEEVESAGPNPTEPEASTSSTWSTTHSPLPTRKMIINTSLGPVIVTGDSSPSPQESEDYRTQEQDEFDRLLDKLSVESTQGRRPAVDRVRTEDSDLLAAASSKSRLTRPRMEIVPQKAAHSKSVPVSQTETNETPSSLGSSSQQLMNGRHNKFSIRHQPQTQFEHLVEDYRYRLSGHNGINDLIKALKNAHIGFFETRGPRGTGQKTSFLRANKRQLRELV